MAVISEQVNSYIDSGSINQLSVKYYNFHKNRTFIGEEYDKMSSQYTVKYKKLGLDPEFSPKE